MEPEQEEFERHLVRLGATPGQLREARVALYLLERKMRKPFGKGKTYHLKGSAYDSLNDMLKLERVKGERVADLVRLAHSLFDEGYGFVHPFTTLRELLGFKHLKDEHTARVIALAHRLSRQGENPSAALDALHGLAKNRLPRRFPELLELGELSARLKGERVHEVYTGLLDVAAGAHQRALGPGHSKSSKERQAAFEASRSALNYALTHALESARKGERPSEALRRLREG